VAALALDAETVIEDPVPAPVPEHVGGLLGCPRVFVERLLDFV